MCPVDLYGDPAIREEMAWHALEQALADAGWLDDARDWSVRWQATAALLQMLEADAGMTLELRQIDLDRTSKAPEGWRFELRAATDLHLGEDAAGLVDLTATLVLDGTAA
jgi:hypothetical protein